VSGVWGVILEVIVISQSLVGSSAVGICGPCQLSVGPCGS
jgi:hypothetical protein